MLNFFQNVKDLQELKKQYYKLALKNHPDRGGNTEVMQLINEEYEYLSKKLIDGNIDFSEGRKVYETEVSEEFIYKVRTVINLEGLQIEIIGSWLWVTGNTKENKETLKKESFKFSRNKVAWYWHQGDYKKRNGKSHSMNDIRSFFGSEKVEKENNNSLKN